MKVFSVDIETTGLDPNIHSIVELAIYQFDLHNKKAPTNIFHRYVYPENMVWSAYCFSLHRTAILDKLITKEIPYDAECRIYGDFDKPKAVPVDRLFAELAAWAALVGDYKDGKLQGMIAAGKNFGSFDYQFIQRLPGYKNCFKHRSLDPTMAYLLQNDEVPPDLAACKKRASMCGLKFDSLEVSHTALDDCFDVAMLLQFAYDNRQWIPND